MNNPLKHTVQILAIVFFCLALYLQPVQAENNFYDTEHYQQKDTVPPSSIFRKIGRYMDSLRNRRYRDSVLLKITRHDDSVIADDNAMQKSEQIFAPYTGKVIRNIYFRKVKVFGPRDINDTAFSSSMKLIRIANRLHYDSREWVIRQSLFFRENALLNPYTLADNERYLRSLPFIQDARLNIVNAMFSTDSVDIVVVTKDVFEYGFNLSKVTTSAFAARVYNNDLFGAGQALQLGVLWRNDYNPTWNTEIRYTKYNISGSFIDGAIGYSTLNNYMPLDTGVYEGSYYISLSRPLYRTRAQLIGGFTFSRNHSINIYNLDDDLYRDYRYQVSDIWAGYNFRNQFRKDGSERSQPNLAILARNYNLNFGKTPLQGIYASDPNYNNRSYWLGQFVIFRQQFFKTHHFFGYGRTEDIPLGYTIALTAGKENWIGRKRLYAGVEVEKFWPIKNAALLHTQLGVGNFWQYKTAEDAVIHAAANHYTRLFKFKRTYLRQFTYIDYIISPNNHFYKPLNINWERGIWGYKDTRINGYQRLNLRSETVLYSALRAYGFKFNFFSSLQGSFITSRSRSIFKSSLYSGLGLGFRVRNENLPLNTLKVAVNYYPSSPQGVKTLWFEVTTVTDFRFNISSLKAPAFVNFQ
ncbi:MAG: hypothetical protein H7122_10670 [Chitinophagaceae bacterium]|nr:hypothetical protein [Chitinophagaceae bacterium]